MSTTIYRLRMSVSGPTINNHFDLYFSNIDRLKSCVRFDPWLSNGITFRHVSQSILVNPNDDDDDVLIFLGPFAGKNNSSEQILFEITPIKLDNDNFCF